MAETVGVTPRDEEEIQNNNEDPFLNRDALTTSSGCSASSLSASLNEDKGSSAVPERLSILSSKAMAHVTQAGSNVEGNTAPCSPSQAIWMKTAKVMETLENRKKEEKEKYRLQLAMYRRLLLLRSIRSLHKQLEQQQARLQECYGTVINTKKEVLKHIRSTSTSPSP
ncbi:UPF0500 protein C1orf216 homolog [Columba livia]|uniref:UPF0500 protein C1orf216 homolog n=1 Tax=Columba livia TaxID=8932 RepID=UPI0031BA7B91